MSNYSTAGLFHAQPSQGTGDGNRNYENFWCATFSDTSGQSHTIRFPVPVRWNELGGLQDNEAAIRRTASEYLNYVLRDTGIDLPREAPDSYGTRWIDYGRLNLSMTPESGRIGDRFDFFHWRDQVTEL